MARGFGRAWATHSSHMCPPEAQQPARHGHTCLSLLQASYGHLRVRLCGTAGGRTAPLWCACMRSCELGLMPPVQLAS